MVIDMAQTRLSANVFDRIGTRLIRVAEMLLLYSGQTKSAHRVTQDVTRSQREIEAVDSEAIKQMEAETRAMEQMVQTFVSRQLDRYRALQVSQGAQVQNRQALEVLEAHLAEMDLDSVQDDTATLATILGYGNYVHLLQTEVPLWEMLLGLVDLPVFAGAFGKQEAGKQQALFASLRETVNELKKVDGILAEPE